MTTDLDIFSTAGLNEAVDEQARNAVRTGRKLLPMLTSYARAITKNKRVRVVLATSDNGSTDGTRINWRPPYALGVNHAHERRFCDKRGGDGIMLCPACAKMEAVLVIIFHEIAHICFETFAEISEEDKIKTVEAAIKERGSKYSKKVQEALAAAPYWKKANYVQLANLVSPFMPFLVNALEDARVNRELFKARKGTKAMFDVNTRQIFERGVEQKEPGTGKIVVKMWNEYPLNAQASVGCFAKASGYDYKGWFDPRVEEALNDMRLTEILNQLNNVRSVSGIYHLAFSVLERLRELGFCRSEIDPPDDEEQDDQSDESGGDSSDSESDTQDDESSGDSAGEPGSGDSGSESDNDGSSDAESSDNDDEASNSGGADGENGSDEGDVSSSGEPDDSTGTGEDEASGGSDDESGGDSSDDGLDDDEGSDSSGEVGDDGDSDGMSSSTEDAEGEEEGESGSSAGGEGMDQDDAGDVSEDGSSSGDEAMDEHDSSSETGGSSSDSSAEEDSEWGDEQGNASSGDAAGTSGDSETGGDESGEPQRTADTEFGSGDIEGEPVDDNAEERADDEVSDSGGGPDSFSGEQSESSDVPADDLSSGSSGEDSKSNNEDETRTGEDGSGYDSSSPDEDLRGDAAERSDDRSDPRTGEDKEGEPIDTGADDGYGGTELIEDEALDDIPLGEPEEVGEALKIFGEHDEKPKTAQEVEQDTAMDRAVVQGLYFETPSKFVFGVREHHFGQETLVGDQNMNHAWDPKYIRQFGYSSKEAGIDTDLDIPESVLGPALQRMRVVFSDNQRGHDKLHLRSGRVNSRVLGRRAWVGDDRLFRSRTLPGKKSYFVCIGVDVSGSTIGLNLSLEKRAVMAQAELLSRMGIPFAVYAHSGNYHSPEGGRRNGLDLDIYLVKEPKEPWSTGVQERLRCLGPDSSNLDGHSLEYYRKVLDRRPENEKILMYYTDGKMPAENYDEELEILQREIKICRRKGYTLMGVGIRTDSPIQHGLDTVQVDDDDDISKVVRHLEKRLVRS